MVRRVNGVKVFGFGMPEAARRYMIDHTEEYPWDCDMQTTEDEWAFEEGADGEEGE